jgi:hypothetical protein
MPRKPGSLPVQARPGQAYTPGPGLYGLLRSLIANTVLPFPTCFFQLNIDSLSLSTLASAEIIKEVADTNLGCSYSSLLRGYACQLCPRPRAVSASRMRAVFRSVVFCHLELDKKQWSPLST